VRSFTVARRTVDRRRELEPARPVGLLEERADERTVPPTFQPNSRASPSPTMHARLSAKNASFDPAAISTSGHIAKSVSGSTANCAKKLRGSW
jgi:hypothetical protein